MSILSIEMPFTEPVLIIALILTIILIGPVLFERIRIPAIVGLLLSGALIGENGFNLVPNDLEFTLLSTMGLLYLMFLAGLEIDLIDFLENKIKSIFIGIVSYLVPFLLGFVVSRYLLGTSVHASWLIGAMLSSHTLISYPLMGRLGIVNKSIVTIIVGATIIADILALVTMELIIDLASKGFDLNNLLHLLLNFLIFFLVVFLVIPRIARIFLSRYEGELGVQYIFVMFVLFVAAVTAHLLHLEPILGAFFSGLVLNRQIINTSPLYKRIEFIGNNLFHPLLFDIDRYAGQFQGLYRRSAADRFAGHTYCCGHIEQISTGTVIPDGIPPVGPGVQPGVRNVCFPGCICRSHYPDRFQYGNGQ